MAKHYVRDVRITPTGFSQEGAMPNYSVLIYHFLRTCGFEWIWECDGNAGDNPTHIDDGNMETVGVGDWADVGTPTTKQKVTTPIRQGTQALEIVSSDTGEGVQSNGLVSTRANTDYHIAVWANNNSGANWEVWWYDGAGPLVKAGDISSDGAYQAYHFDVTTAGSGTPYIQIISGFSGSQTIHIDGIIIFESYFEYAGLHDEGTDGSITNPDQFTSPSDYTFSSSDIGRYVCVYDSTNPTNSGCYEITGESAGTVTLDLKSTTGTLTTQASLAFRVIDLDSASVPVSTNMENWIRSVGWGLESPHASGWRVFFRHSLENGQTNKAIIVWAAPEDTEYDYETGTFLDSGPSTQRGYDDPYDFDGTGNLHCWAGGYDATVAYGQRFFLMMEDDFSFFTFVQYSSDPSPSHGVFFVGYTGADPYNTGIMEFDLCCRSDFSTANMLSWANTNAWGRDIVTFAPDGHAAPGLLAQLGYGVSSSGIFNQAGNIANPFSSEEWLVPIHTTRYGEGESPEGSFKPWSIGMYQSRSNITDMTTFDSEQYMHFDLGLVWAWNGYDLT